MSVFWNSHIVARSPASNHLHIITREQELKFRKYKMEREIAFLELVYEKKANWIERIQGLKQSLDLLQCDLKCYFYDKSYHKCTFCQHRSRMSWVLKTCVNKLVHSGCVVSIYVEPRARFCQLVQNFDDLIYNMEVIESEILQNYEVSPNEFRRIHDIMKECLFELKNKYSSTADQLAALQI